MADTEGGVAEKKRGLVVIRPQSCGPIEVFKKNPKKETEI